MALTPDFYDHLIGVSLALRTPTYRFRAPFRDRAYELRLKPVPPEPGTFAADIDAALAKRVRELAEQERKSGAY